MCPVGGVPGWILREVASSPARADRGKGTPGESLAGQPQEGAVLSVWRWTLYARDELYPRLTLLCATWMLRIRGAVANSPCGGVCDEWLDRGFRNCLAVLKTDLCKGPDVWSRKEKKRGGVRETSGEW